MWTGFFLHGQPRLRDPALRRTQAQRSAQANAWSTGSATDILGEAVLGPATLEAMRRCMPFLLLLLLLLLVQDTAEAGVVNERLKQLEKAVHCPAPV